MSMHLTAGATPVPPRWPQAAAVAFALFCMTPLLFTAGCNTSRPPETAGPSTTASPASGSTAVPAATEPPRPASTAPIPRPNAATPSPVRPVFDDVAAASGIDFTYDRDVVPGRWLIVEVMGGGVAWIDADLDGWLDLFFTNGGAIEPDRGPPREASDQLFRSLGRSADGAGADGDVTFRNVTTAAGVDRSQADGVTDRGYGQGVAVGDYDADGFPDLYVANYGANRLLHNNGDGTFSDVTTEAGVGDTSWGTNAFFADLDFDGLLDLYVANFLDQTPENGRPCEYGGDLGYCGPGSYRGVQDLVYVGQGDGTFLEQSARLGFVEPDGLGKGLAAVAVDLDDDLRPEVYVGNDMTPNLLYTTSGVDDAVGNSGSVRYQEIGMAAGCALSDQGENEATMGIVCEDLDDDGRPDLFLAHFHKAKNTLYRNLGGLLFSDESRRTRIAATSFDNLGFGSVALDWDRDGLLDLFVTTGHVLGPNNPPEQMPPQLLRRIDRTRFADVSSEVAGPYFAGLWLGRGVAGGDYDNDGDLDIAVAHNDSPSALLANRTAAPGRFLGLELTTPDRIPPVGGRVEVVSGKIRMVRPLFAGGSYQASHDPRLLFTLEKGDAPADVTIHWPSGRIDRLSLDGNRYWRIMEGSGPEVAPIPVQVPQETP